MRDHPFPFPFLLGVAAQTPLPIRSPPSFHRFLLIGQPTITLRDEDDKYLYIKRMGLCLYNWPNLQPRIRWKDKNGLPLATARRITRSLPTQPS